MSAQTQYADSVSDGRKNNGFEAVNKAAKVCPNHEWGMFK
jgi:hypothetical protein